MEIINFDSHSQLDDYIGYQTDYMPLGQGTEGVCYRGKDGKAYKVYSKDGYREFYPLETILTKDDFSLKSFAFPETIFTVDGYMEAYTSTLVPRNLFDDEHLTVSGIKDINFDNLIEAYKIMSDEVNLLTKSGIVFSDLPGNILFDGVNLVAIDTCDYVKNDTSGESLSNQALIDEAIKEAFDKLFEDEESEGLFVNPNQDTVSYLRDIEATFKSTNKVKVHSMKR